MIDAVALGCQEFVELVTAYLEGALDSGDQRRFDEHLGACGNCVENFGRPETTRKSGY